MYRPEWTDFSITEISFGFLMFIKSVHSSIDCIYSPLTRRTPWRSQDGRMSTVTSSGHLSIPWSLALCWAQGSSSSAWSSLSSVSLFFHLQFPINLDSVHLSLAQKVVFLSWFTRLKHEVKSGQRNVLMVPWLSFTLYKYEAAKIIEKPKYESWNVSAARAVSGARCALSTRSIKV